MKTKILFYPDPPVQRYAHSLSKTIRYFSWGELTNDINSDWDVGVWWNYKDVNTPLKRLVDDKRPVLNLYCGNVTKSHVDKVFKSVFGYSSMANTERPGMCVRKSEDQAAHDGKFMQTPLIREKGYIYQIPIDNRISQRWIRDIRVPVFLGKVPILFIKDRTIEITFDTGRGEKNYNMADPLEYLSKDELAKIIEFSYKIGLDLGEIDTIRDNSTGKLYIIDVNDIPGGEVFNKIKGGRYWEQYLTKYLKKQINKL